MKLSSKMYIEKNKGSRMDRPILKNKEEYNYLPDIMIFLKLQELDSMVLIQG